MRVMYPEPMAKGLWGQIGGTQLGQQHRTNELLEILITEQRQTNFLLAQLYARFAPPPPPGLMVNGVPVHQH